MSRLPVAIALLAPMVGARAGDCVEPGWNEGAPARLASIAATNDARTYFLRNASDAPGCPSADAACRLKAYLVPGDEVVVWSHDGEHACASFSGAKGRVTTGFLPTAALVFADPAARDLADWLGTWTRVEAEIRIEAAGEDRVVVSGDATWGAEDPERVERGGVHIGTIDPTTVAIGGESVVRFATGEEPDDPEDEYRCRVSLQLLGDRLLVSDNFQCGGANVSFSGTYVRSGH